MKSDDFKLLPGSMFIADEGVEPDELFRKCFKKYKNQCLAAYGIVVVWVTSVVAMVWVGTPISFIALTAFFGITIPYRLMLPEYSYLRRAGDLPLLEADAQYEGRDVDYRWFTYLTGVAYARFGLLAMTVCWVSCVLSVAAASPENISFLRALGVGSAFAFCGWSMHDDFVKLRPYTYGLRKVKNL